MPRRAETHEISLPLDALPGELHQHLARIRDRRDDGQIDLVPDLYDRMTRTLCQYGWLLRESGLPFDFTIASLRAFYSYETTRISNRKAPLRPATVKATVSDLRDFLRFSKASPKRLTKELNKLLKKLHGRPEVQTLQKFAALAGIDIMTIHPRADKILANVAKRTSPANRHIQRNRAMAIAVPPLIPLRREWHDLRFGRDLVPVLSGARTS